MDYFISDLHFNHQNIIQYCNRPFETVEEMNKILIKNWVKKVKSIDRVFFLGDFCLGGREQIAKFANQLTGKKIMIKGNHERSNNQIYYDAGFSEVSNFPIIYKTSDGCKAILSHQPEREIPEGFISIHGHIHDLTVRHDSAFCVSVEHTNYTPVTLNEILNEINYKKDLGRGYYEENF